MAFLSKKEQTLINIVNSNEKLSNNERNALLADIKYNAQLRQDQYRKPVRIFLSVISDFQNTNILKQVLK